MSFRKEIKFKLSSSDVKIFKGIFQELGMVTLFPKRKINSCYFDTPDLILFFESEEGILPRKKIRHRWYKDKKIILEEIKISSIEGRYKTSEKLIIDSDYELNNQIHFDKDYGLLTPKIIVSYDREYFFYKNLRLTIDTNIKYQDIQGLSRKIVRDFENVLEIKTSINTSQNYLEKLLQIRPARFSKYCRGVLRLKNQL